MWWSWESGEPLDNYDNLLTFIRMLTDENGLHISQRNLTVSTCGLVPRIRDLAKEGLQITLGTVIARIQSGETSGTDAGGKIL